MRRDVAEADRCFVVRESAAAWRKAGVIDDATLRAMEAMYPDDRRRLGLGLRLLAGIATFVGGLAVAGMLLTAFGPGEKVGILSLAIGFTIATELQIGRLRRAQSGAEYATAMLAAGCASGFLAMLLGFGEAPPVLAACAVVWGVAAWRWGYAFFAGVAALFLLGSVLDAPYGRLAWVAAGSVGLLALLGPARSIRPAPSHRRSLAWASLVFLSGAYVACNVYVLDEFGLQPFRGYRTAADWVRALAILATAVAPLAVVALGLRRRDRSLLALGVLFVAASIVTLHHYVAFGPAWFRLVLGGAACGGSALAAGRWLAAGDNRERGGYTAEPLYAERHGFEVAQAVVTLATMSPGARPEPSRRFEGGGGLSGGGGATGGF